MSGNSHLIHSWIESDRARLAKQSEAENFPSMHKFLH